MTNNIKKSLKLSTLITIIINMICLLVNLICAYTINILPFGLKFYGGECIEYIGFGVSLLKIFPMTTANEEIINNSQEIRFDITSLLITMLLCFIIFMIIILIINKIKNKKTA